MTKPIISIIISSLIVSTVMAQTNALDSTGIEPTVIEATNTEQSKKKTTDENSRTDSFEVFIPTEEIQGDQSVDFPTDI